MDYKAMVKGQIADIRLMPDDILFVPESGGLKALHTSTASRSFGCDHAAGRPLMIYH